MMHLILTRTIRVSVLSIFLVLPNVITFGQSGNSKPDVAIRYIDTLQVNSIVFGNDTSVFLCKQTSDSCILNDIILNDFFRNFELPHMNDLLEDYFGYSDESDKSIISIGEIGFSDHISDIKQSKFNTISQLLYLYKKLNHKYELSKFKNLRIILYNCLGVIISEYNHKKSIKKYESALKEISDDLFKNRGYSEDFLRDIALDLLRFINTKKSYSYLSKKKFISDAFFKIPPIIKFKSKDAAPYQYSKLLPKGKS